jgi:hypothetical protein
VADSVDVVAVLSRDEERRAGMACPRRIWVWATTPQPLWVRIAVVAAVFALLWLLVGL